ITTTPQDCIKEGHLLTPHSLQTTLQTLLSKDNVKHDNSCITLPSNLVIHKQLNISKNMSARQIQAKAEHESQKLFSESADDLYIDFTQSDSLNDHKVLNIIATHKKDLEPYIQVLKKSHLKLMVVDVDYYALERIYPLLCRSLTELGDDDHVAVFYMTSEYFVMTVHQNSQLVYTHHHLFHNPNLATLVRQLISGDDQTTITLSDDDYDSINKNISHLLQFFFAEFSDTKIKHILLTGPLALLPQLDTRITSSLSIDTLIVNPLDGVKNQSSFETTELMRLAPAFTLSLALAIRG
ncbi:MAG: hypothetical protein COB66_08260, partial [Coxiella sp. (in: Bacteria)]